MTKRLRIPEALLEMSMDKAQKRPKTPIPVEMIKKRREVPQAMLQLQFPNIFALG